MEYTWYIHGYSIDIPWIYHGYPWRWIYMAYPWIYHWYQHSIYMVYPWISMVYPLMYKHGIYMVYPWIFLEIPSFLKPDFAAGPCCWSHSMRTRVWVIKSVLFHAPPWRLCQGKRWPTKGSTRLLQTSPLCPWRRRWQLRLRWCRGGLSVLLVL